MPRATHDSRQAPRFAPLPDTGRVYRQRSLVGPGDTAADGRAHLDAIVRWIQEVAYADVVDVEMGEPGAWVVRRSHVLVRQVPRFGERIELATFCSAIGASVAERRTRIEGNHGSEVDAAVLWVHIDDEARTPKRFPDEFLSIYGPSADGRRARSGLHLPPPPDDAKTGSWRFGVADVDLADHVNNTAFLRLLADVLIHPGASDGLELEAEYRSPVRPGEVSVRSTEDRLWVVDGDRRPSAAFRLTTLA